MWRWGSLVDCARALKKRKGPLQACWCLKQFMAGGREEALPKRRNRAGACVEAGADGEPASHNRDNNDLFYKFSGAVLSKFFWCYLDSCLHRL